jgi:hypothetical protein
MLLRDRARLLIVYKNFAQECNISHIGMGVTAAYTAKSLHRAGYDAEARPIFGADDRSTYIESQMAGCRPVTHVVICAQWIDAKSMAKMVRRFTDVKFALNCHSNVAFLQAEPQAIKLLRSAMDLELTVPNFVASCNNVRLQQALERMYRRPVSYLPNLYYLSHQPLPKPVWDGGLLRIGCFGSLRIYKNFSTAVAASIELANDLGAQAEIWINSGRNDGAGNVVYRTAVAWTENVPNVELKQLHWASWPDFKRHIGTMNILMQPSFTETFNNVTADGISQGVPSVVGEAIEWVPHYWQANVDNAGEVAGVARRLLTDPHAPHEGYKALEKYVAHGLKYWQEFLS